MKSIFNFLGNFFNKNNKLSIQSVTEVPVGHYLLNDPSTPELCIEQVIPPTPTGMPFAVDSFNPVNVGSTNPIAWQAVNCHITLARSIQYFQDAVSKFDKPVEHWAAQNLLRVHPRAGQQLNAFYNRDSLNFFYEIDKNLQRMIYTADSVDVVSHELGHALLDCIRPDLWNTQSLEVWAFHEAFGDINAMVTMMGHDLIIENVLAETNGNLNKSNVVSRIAEEMGMTAYHAINGANHRNIAYLRDCSVPYKYVDPHALPQKGNDDELCAEAHSFGKIFASAWYEIFVGIYDQEQATMGQKIAFKFARDVAYSYIIRAVKIAPATIRFTEAVAKSMIAADALQGGTYAKILRNTFLARNVIVPEVKMLSTLSWDQVRDNLERHDEVTKRGNLIMVRKKNTKNFVISDHILGGLSTETNPLYSVEMEVPADRFYYFENGQLTDEIHVGSDEILKSSIICALAINNYHGLGEDKMWKITKENKLVRNHIECPCC